MDDNEEEPQFMRPSQPKLLPKIPGSPTGPSENKARAVHSYSQSTPETSCPKKDRKFTYFFYTLIVALIFALVIAIFVLEPAQRETLFTFDSQFDGVHTLFIFLIYGFGFAVIINFIFYLFS